MGRAVRKLDRDVKIPGYDVNPPGRDVNIPAQDSKYPTHDAMNLNQGKAFLKHFQGARSGIELLGAEARSGGMEGKRV
ncbi:MAG: hypothetical protein JXR70_12355 [Spirochaetales bacterium]|nr:hypothetical protein [Spirochaetales bacterium]